MNQPEPQVPLEATVVQNFVQFVSRDRRVLIKLEATLEFVLLRSLLAFLGRARTLEREEAHDRVAVMPRRLIGDQLARLIADRTEHDHPGKHLRVADLVELFVGHVDEHVVISLFHFGNGPVVEIEIRLGVLPRAREVRHSAAGHDGNLLWAGRDYFRNRLTQLRAALRRRQGRKIRIHENWDDRNGALLDHPFIDSRERVSENSVLRVAQVETRGHELVQKIFGQALVDGHLVSAAGKFGVGKFAATGWRMWARNSERKSRDGRCRSQ